MKRWFTPVVLFTLILTPAPISADSDECYDCHDDTDLESEDGRPVGVDPDVLSASTHAEVDCRDCHVQDGDYEDAPHFERYQRVRCARCHAESSRSFAASFHGRALARGDRSAPGCGTCHGRSHAVERLNLRTAERACRRCHERQTELYDTSVHRAAARAGKASPGCISCHPTHDGGLPPSVGAVNKLCEACHQDAMAMVETGGHTVLKLEGKMSCASCHDVHATHRPQVDRTALQACENCHPDYRAQFAGSVHEEVLDRGEMTCISCHRTHQVEGEAAEAEGFGCGGCHEEVEADYRKSAHRMARLHGDAIAATCDDCHGSHNVVPTDDLDSPVHPCSEPDTCGKCHSENAVITTDYVRLPISLPRYLNSVHGINWQVCQPTAVCSDCHNSHLLLTASHPDSSIHKTHLANTCGECHEKESQEYVNSVHGRALNHGIDDSPSCTDCHEEHLILAHTDPASPVHPANLSHDVCANCHEDPELAARYGLPAQVIESYEDSYHGWAVQRGGKKVAVCVDCHNTHAIGSVLDPESSIHKNNVVETCGRCHANANPQFAASYTHVLAHGRLMIHDWVRIFYVWFVVLVLGGMVFHNLLLYLHDLRHHLRHHKQEPAVRRMTRAEIIQHALLVVTFFGLAISGFALRFPDAFWVEWLTAAGFTEEFRRGFHRVAAVLLVVVSLYHVAYLLFTRRGRALGWALLPRPRDVREALQNLLYHLGRREERPRFAGFDYTQKAEYWALVWGTIVMSVTGLVLWFPALATDWLPAWVVRVCEVVHFYEAILAVSAIFIWHFYFVILRPAIYPMSWIWLDGRMPAEEWKGEHPDAEASLTIPAEE
jgi:formate dehydrogenase gamma subunit